MQPRQTAECNNVTGTMVPVKLHVLQLHERLSSKLPQMSPQPPPLPPFDSCTGHPEVVEMPKFSAWRLTAKPRLQLMYHILCAPFHTLLIW